jgi:hypothetical protein
MPINHSYSWSCAICSCTSNHSTKFMYMIHITILHSLHCMFIAILWISCSAETEIKHLLKVRQQQLQHYADAARTGYVLYLESWAALQFVQRLGLISLQTDTWETTVCNIKSILKLSYLCLTFDSLASVPRWHIWVVLVLFSSSLSRLIAEAPLRLVLSSSGTSYSKGIIVQ